MIFWLVNQSGQHLQAGAPALGFGTGSHHDPGLIARLLLALAVVMASAQALGKLCARWQQPPVMGEVLEPGWQRACAASQTGRRPAWECS